jgi:tRNA threonylcarbamoyladenosine biosynthesis protein TsaB
MNKALILHIETATDICSVALSKGDQQLSLVESDQERSHASLLNKFIRQVFSDSGQDLKQLNGVAVSMGPGSYTGLRIGVSTAKGIAYALDIPLLASGTLENMAHGCVNHPEVIRLVQEADRKVLLCPMLDARRMEVYAGFYSRELKVVRGVSADIIDENSYRKILKKYQVCFFGNGSGKCKEILSHPHAHFIEGIHPSAASMIGPVIRRFEKERFEDVAYFEPFYLKDFIATTPKKKVL